MMCICWEWELWTPYPGPRINLLFLEWIFFYVDSKVQIQLLEWWILFDVASKIQIQKFNEGPNKPHRRMLIFLLID